MTAESTSSRAKRSDDTPPLMLGGYAALAESEWMGVAQDSDVLEPLHISAPRRRRAIIPRLPRLRLSGLLTREFTIAEASFVLMASFFFSARLGAVRLVLFNAQFGAGLEASAYYAAFRLPDTLFSLIAGGALSSAMIPVLLSASREEGENAGWRLTNLVLTTLPATGDAWRRICWHTNIWSSDMCLCKSTRELMPLDYLAGENNRKEEILCRKRTRPSFSASSRRPSTRETWT